MQAIGALVAGGDPRAAEVLAALADGALQTAGKRVLIVRAGEALDAATGEKVAPLPAEREDVVANNRLRGAIGRALAALKLVSRERGERLAAARALAGGADASMLPLVKRTLEAETDADVRSLLELIAASMELKAGDKRSRLSAIRTLGSSGNPSSKTLLLEAAADADAEIRAEAQKSLLAVDARLRRGEWLGLAFAGVSLGSILLLAALGLAITYGLMGVINMAHGELIMVGAYTTYMVQNLFRGHAPGAFDWYLACAVPASFMVAALLGMALERSVIRWLYGRPLETLLATWGISLVLMQGVRSLFGAQNVQVENPSWLSGGVQALSNLTLPFNRIAIIVFAALVLGGLAFMVARTRLGLFVRGVTQNRPMAACMGVNTAKVDTYAFALGSGIAGLAGCALSQVGNVGPDLGQGYIVDAFMVVVLCGVGQ